MEEDLPQLDIEMTPSEAEKYKEDMKELELRLDEFKAVIDNYYLYLHMREQYGERIALYEEAPERYDKDELNAFITEVNELHC